jgi:hypothetical protein
LIGFAGLGVGALERQCQILSTQLQDLQAKLEDDIGFIEQIDIDEMSELVSDLLGGLSQQWWWFCWC